jgi:hypothetical protein
MKYILVDSHWSQVVTEFRCETSIFAGATIHYSGINYKVEGATYIIDPKKCEVTEIELAFTPKDYSVI